MKQKEAGMPQVGYVYHLGYYGYEGGDDIYLTHPTRVMSDEEFQKFAVDVAIAVVPWVIKSESEIPDYDYLPHLHMYVSWETLVAPIAAEMITNHGFSRLVITATATAPEMNWLTSSRKRPARKTDTPDPVNDMLHERLKPILKELGFFKAYADHERAENERYRIKVAPAEEQAAANGDSLPVDRASGGGE